MTRQFAADDFAAIRDRMQELRGNPEPVVVAPGWSTDEIETFQRLFDEAFGPSFAAPVFA